MVAGLILGLLARRRGIGASSLSYALRLYVVLYAALTGSLLS
ncbi:MAG: hypothetical protein QXU52_00440 [Fervidicoccaceae archaeon]